MSRPAAGGGGAERAPRPALLSFDIFGTVLDWREGHRRAIERARGAPLGGREFDRLFDAVVDRQGAIEQAEPELAYAEVVARSLRDEAGLSPAAAAAAGADAGGWPLFGDSARALGRLAVQAPLVAMTNSDVAHGVEIRRRLAAMDPKARFAHWIPAQELGFYKPDPRFWHEAARRTGRAPGASWWHVSAYADYDLEVARSLGLTTVFIARPHARPPAPDRPADLVCRNLADLADRLARS